LFVSHVFVFSRGQNNIEMNDHIGKDIYLLGILPANINYTFWISR